MLAKKHNAAIVCPTPNIREGGRSEKILESEGHKIIMRGKQYLVSEYKKNLISLPASKNLENILYI